MGYVIQQQRHSWLLVAAAPAVTAKAVVMAEAAGHAARRVLATALAVTAKKAVAEAVYTARYHRVLALKLTAAQKLQGAGCHVDAYELDAGAADPSHRGAGGEDGEVSGGLPPDGSGAAGAGAGGR